MDNLILIENDNTFLVNKKIDELNTNKYYIEEKDLSNIDINDVIVDLDTYNFINPNRIVICTNIDNMFKSDLTLFEKYIDNPNKDNVLVLVTSNLDNRKKISKKINKLFKKIEIEVNPINFIKNNLEDYTMDNNTMMELIDITNADIASISNELNKLKMYKLEDKKIEKKDIDTICYRNINDSDDYVFKFIDCILNKETKKAFDIYHDLKKLNVEDLSLIGLVSSQIRSMLQVMILDYKMDKDIANELNMHPYRVKKIREKNSIYTKKDLIEFLKKLASIDFKVKSGIINSTLAMELLIVG